MSSCADEGSQENGSTTQNAPGAPTNVVASPGDTLVTISWDPVTGADSYNLYWSNTFGVTAANGTQIAGATSPYSHTDMTKGTAYYYVVTAVNAGGESAESSEVNATPQVPAPGAPTNVAASPGDTEVTISWDPVTGADSYNLYWSTTSGVTKSIGTQITGVTSPYPHTGRTNGTAYYYVVTAANAGGESAESVEVNATPQVPAPGAPTNVAASPGDTLVTISWSPVTGADSYNLYWSNTTGVTKGTGTEITGVASPYPQTGRTNGTAYYYVVTAVNAGGESAESAEVNATPQVSAPGAPTNVAASPGDTQVTISWDPVAGADSYNLYWSNTSGVTAANGTQIAGATSPYPHSSLTNDTAYYYVVTAVNAGGEGAESVEVSATPQVPAPGAPSNVAASPGDTQVTVSWDPVTGADSYNLYWSNTSGVTAATGTQITSVTSPYPHPSLTNGTAYYYVVTVVIAGGESPESVEVNATPKVPAPGPPTNVAASPGDTQVTISWDPVTGADSYNLYWSNTTGVTKSTGTQITSVTSPYPHASRTNGTPYYYVVTAENARGESAESAEVNATPQVSAPGAPINVAASPGDTQVTISWDPVTGADSYNLYWSTTSGVTAANGTQITSVTSPYPHPSLSNGTAYYYVVTAVNAGGESPESVEVNATPQVPAPGAPTNVAASPGDTQVTISWDPVTGADSYNLYWSTTSGVTKGTGTQITNVTSPYPHPSLTNGTPYYYVVTAVNAGGESAESVEVSTTPFVLSVVQAAPIVTGNGHTCALLDNGSTKCWGNNNAGQLGLGDTEDRGGGPGEMGDALTAVDLGTGRTAAALAIGIQHSCALLDNGTVKCWGRNTFGELGLGDTSHRGDQAGEMGDALTAVDLGTGRAATALAIGSQHSCALLDNGTVKCWGRNFSGQIGLGDTEHRGDEPGEMGDNLPAVDLGTGRAALALAASGGHGAKHTCALLDDGTVKCWGYNNWGQLGIGDQANRGDQPGEMGNLLPAVDLGSDRTAVALTAGSGHTCALLDNGTVKCWGRNSFGELGLGDTEFRGWGPGEMGDALPTVELGTGRTANGLAAGNYLNILSQLFFEHGHTCAILDDASIKCWGDNKWGQLGLGDTEIRGDEPGEMGDNLPAVDLGTGRSGTGLDAGGGNTCVSLDDGTFKCWGVNYQGKLGLGDFENRGDEPGEMGDNLPAVDLGTF